MKSYKVTACYYTYCTAEIEAEDGDQAYDIASSMDGGSFSSTEKGGWQILDIEEVTDGE